MANIKKHKKLSKIIDTYIRQLQPTTKFLLAGCFSGLADVIIFHHFSHTHIHLLIQLVFIIANFYNFLWMLDFKSETNTDVYSEPEHTDTKETQTDSFSGLTFSSEKEVEQLLKKEFEIIFNKK